MNQATRLRRPAMLAMAAALVSLVACKQATEQPIAGKALFDNFVYTGNDDYYNQNPLQSESTFYNPIIAGWASDPSWCTNGEGDYYLVTSTFVYFPGVPIYHSRDLINWELKSYVLSRESQLEKMKGQHVSGGIFAPAISYNPANKTYYMVTTNVGAGNFYVKTQDPLGEWSDPIMLPSVGGIDPSFFFDDNGKAYIVNNDDAPDFKPEYDGHRTIRVQEFDWKNDCTVGERKIIINKGVNPAEKPIWIEGPHMYKINGKYYLMDAEGGTSVNHSEVIFRSDSPFGPFVPWDQNPILTQRHLDKNRPNPVTCAGHADLIQTPEGEWWACFLACRPYAEDHENLGRETFMMPVQWTEDGWPVMTKGDDLVPLQLERPGVTRSEKVTFGNFCEVDNFDSTKLSTEWLTLRTSGCKLYSLTKRPGFLALNCDSITAAQRETPAFIAHRLKHHKFTASTKVVFSPSEGETAGLLLFKDERHHYIFGITMQGGKKQLGVWQVFMGKNTKLASVDFDDNSAELFIESNADTYDFYYSTQDGKRTELFKGASAAFLSTQSCGGFTGTVVGPYAVRTTLE